MWMWLGQTPSRSRIPPKVESIANSWDYMKWQSFGSPTRHFRETGEMQHVACLMLHVAGLCCQRAMLIALNSQPIRRWPIVR